MTQKNLGTGEYDTATSADGLDHAVAVIDGIVQELPFSKHPVSDAVTIALQDAIQAYDAIVISRFDNIAPTKVGPFNVDDQDFANIVDVVAYLAQKAGGGGGSAPIITAAPTISDSTVAVDQIVTVTAGTVSNPGSVTSTLYRWIVNGIAQQTLWALSGSDAVAVGGSAPASNTPLVLEELLYWAGGTPISNKSIQYTLNAGAAVPFNTGLPVVTGSLTPGSTISISGGTWTNSPTSSGYTFLVYDGGAPAQGGLLLTTFAGQTQPMSFVLAIGVYEGKTLVFGVTASNGTGTSSPAYSTPVQISGGTKPASISPVGFMYSVEYGVGDTVYLDYGLLFGTPADYWANNPSATGFNVQMYRNGVPISGGGANITQYVLISSDQDKIISYAVTASNGAGSSNAAFSAGILVVA